MVMLHFSVAMKIVLSSVTYQKYMYPYHMSLKILSLMPSVTFKK